MWMLLEITQNAEGNCDGSFKSTPRRRRVPTRNKSGSRVQRFLNQFMTDLRSGIGQFRFFKCSLKVTQLY